MGEARSPHYEQSCAFAPVNLHDASETQELVDQRVECGWQFTPEYIDKWRKQMDAGEKTIFWILLPGMDNVRAGHISLDSLNKSEHPEIRNSDRSIMTIKTFFISPKYRLLGLGRKSMDAIEEYATKDPYGSPNCKAIVVDTISGRYFTDPELIIERKEWNSKVEDDRSNEEWYKRRGYVKWKEERSYVETNLTTGGEVVLLASFLRKDLK